MICKPKRIVVDRWDEDGNFTITVKVRREPILDKSRKHYVYACEHGDTDILVPIGGVDRNVRMTFMLYIKIPASARRQSLANEATESERRGSPALY